MASYKYDWLGRRVRKLIYAGGQLSETICYCYDGDGIANAQALITFDGSGSTGDGLEYIWYWQGKKIAQGVQPQVVLEFGTYQVVLQVIDECQKVSYDNVAVTVSRTLYDTEGAALVTVGPYDPDVYDDYPNDPSKWPVVTETVYDKQRRVIETRRWAGVRTCLIPFKIVDGQAVPLD